MINLNIIVIIGSGTMGSGIAEQFANIEQKVYLLDIVPQNATDRNMLANIAIQKIAKSLEHAPNFIIPGNIEDDIKIIKKADWVIEAIVENLELKQDLYKKLEKFCKANTIFSSNTSTFQLQKLVHGMSASFKKRFLITHFFNPPRYMQLVEIVHGDFVSEQIAKSVIHFLTFNFGKTPINSNDTPGFIANRLGFYWLQEALNLAVEMNMDIEEVDYLVSSSFCTPKTGIFGLYDLIGIDVAKLILDSLAINLSPQDDFTKSYNKVSILDTMIMSKQLGRKTQSGGFYRLHFDKKGNKQKEVIDLQINEYRSVKFFKESFRNIEEIITKSLYSKRLLCKTLSYALNLVDQVSSNLLDIDMVMKLGFKWKFGPFELIDQIGLNNFKLLLKQENISLPKILLNQNNERFYQQPLKEQSTIFKNNSAEILALSDEIATIEIISKMGILEHEFFDAILRFYERYASNFKALIINNKQDNFSVGANLKFILAESKIKNFNNIAEYIKLGQTAMQKIKYSSIPVIAAAKGRALGGGCEILLHASAVTAHLELNAGLVESKIGLLPGFGGCKEMIIRSKTKDERIRAFISIVLGQVTNSVHKLQEIFILPKIEKVANSNFLIDRASDLAIKMLENFYPIRHFSCEEHDIDWYEIIEKLGLVGYNREVAFKLVEIFSMKKEEDILLKEQEVFINLLKNKETILKIENII